MGKEHGYYCKSRINDQYLNSLCDSGANVSILSKQVYNLLQNKPKLCPVNFVLLAVTGNKQSFAGKANFEIQLGAQRFLHEMLVADIVEDAIIGIDFMKQHSCDLIISKNYMRVGSEKVPCYMKTKQLGNCCRVAIEETIEIPSNTEMILPGKTLDDTGSLSCCLMTSYKNFMDKTGLLVAKTLVNPVTGNVPVRLINLSDKPIVVFKDTVTAQIEPVDIAECELVGHTDAVKCKEDFILPEHLHTL